MPMPNGMFFDFRDILIKMAIFFGAFIIIYGVLWLLVDLSIIPVIFLAIFPQIILILIGIFIIYIAFTKRNTY